MTSSRQFSISAVKKSDIENAATDVQNHLVSFSGKKIKVKFNFHPKFVGCDLGEVRENFEFLEDLTEQEKKLIENVIKQHGLIISGESEPLPFIQECLLRRLQKE